MNKKKCSHISSISIIFDKTDNRALINTQLDDELTMQVLKICINELKAKTSQEVPIGKEK